MLLVQFMMMYLTTYCSCCMLLQQSYELMRHAKRRKLTTVDFNNALQNADVQVTLSCYSSRDLLTGKTSNIGLEELAWLNNCLEYVRHMPAFGA